MMNKTILMLSVSCMSFIAGTDLCYAGFNPDDTPPELSAAMLKSHVSTHTSHLTAAHLSSPEDFAGLTLPENSGRDREGFKPSLTLPNSLGREEKTKQSSSDLLRGSRWNKSAALSDLDTPIKLEYDIERNTSPLRGEVGLRSRTGEGDNKLVQLAGACFVTDTSGCSGNEFVGNNADEDDGGVPPGGGDDYDLDNDRRCIEEGYLLTSCPEGYEPYNYCPYDRTYFEKCVSSCPSDYVTCEEPYHGVGEACDGKYASCECTPCGSGYDYTTIPEGYIQDGEACLDCDAKTKYKIKPNPCDGYMDCGNMGSEIGAGTCQSGNETLYDNCKACPYECSLSSCPEPFTCTKEECSGMYCKNGCQSGYDWDAATQSCTEQCAYKCTLDSCPSGFVCEKEECSGKYCKSGCQPGYNWDAATQSCTCEAKYKYTCSGTGYAGGSGNSCDNKYESCRCAEGYVWDAASGICKINQAEWGKCNGYAKNCNIGDILYSDGTCASSVVSGKTPIAVVVYKSDDGNCAQAMALNSLGKYAWKREGGGEIATGLPVYSDGLSASRDFKSCENTAIITAAGGTDLYPAAWAAEYYTTEGTKFSDWCLPAAGIFTSIFNNSSIINSGFEKAGGQQIENNYISWTSSGGDNSYRVWISYLIFDDFFGDPDPKTYGLSSYWAAEGQSYDVRPVLEF